MKKRYIYSILFGVPGFFVSLTITFIIFGATAGFIWIYVYGDNPWPKSTEKVLPVLFVLTFLVLWISSIILGLITGRNLEGNLSLQKSHILASIGATTLPIVLITLYQLSVGNIGPKSDSTLCSEFCGGKGFSVSGMPPNDSGERTCSCFDSDGQEAIKIPMNVGMSDVQE